MIKEIRINFFIEFEANIIFLNNFACQIPYFIAVNIVYLKLIHLSCHFIYF